ncbi:MAG: hypothetical protein ACREIT_07155, partial [Tepidisphaeraceae bacterium]
MRSFLAGLLLAFILPPSFTLAQATGEVEGIGFSNNYRPDCWTPMVVRLMPTTDKTDTFQLQVTQGDLDQDQILFTRTITLTGNTGGSGGREQRFWMYFIPEPSQGGLPHTMQPGSTLKDLQSRLKVRLCTMGGKELVKLPITSTITNLDPPVSQLTWGAPRGAKLILCISDGISAPMWREYQQKQNIIGVVEDAIFITVQPKDLPESALGFQAVDHLVWLNASPPDPNNPVDEKKMRALQEWVRQGGRLTICQPADWQRTISFGDLLPVSLEGVTDQNILEPLATLATPKSAQSPARPPIGAYKIGLATQKPGTLVEEWATIKGQRFPYIVRSVYGLGAVTWVAQDLGDPGITKNLRTGWPFVWDSVFDWKNQTRIVTQQTPDPEKLEYAQSGGVDFGRALLGGVNL